MIVFIFLSSLWTWTDSSAFISGGKAGLLFKTGTTRSNTISSTPGVEEALASSSMPYFADPENSMNVTGQLGAAAELHCRVNRLPGETSVSWMRRQEGQLRLLAVGLELYSSDTRYQVRLLESSDWQLRVRSLRESDQGHYECQVPSHPPTVHTVYLHVVVPELKITDERDMPIEGKFYNSGSTIQLKCRLTRVPRPTHFLLWRHGANILNYDTKRGGISVRTDLTEDGAWSRLLVAHAGPQDSGNYSCSLADVADATVTVHVLNNGETPAAMQHGGSPQHLTVCWTLGLTLGLLVLR